MANKDWNQYDGPTDSGLATSQFFRDICRLTKDCDGRDKQLMQEFEKREQERVQKRIQEIKECAKVYLDKRIRPGILELAGKGLTCNFHPFINYERIAKESRLEGYFNIGDTDVFHEELVRLLREEGFSVEFHGERGSRYSGLSISWPKGR